MLHDDDDDEEDDPSLSSWLLWETEERLAGLVLSLGWESICHHMMQLMVEKFAPSLSGPVRDTSPYRAIPFRDTIAEGGIAPICLVFIGYRAGIAEIPLLRGGGYRTSTSHALQGGKAQKRGRGYRTQWAMLRHQKPHSAHARGVSPR